MGIKVESVSPLIHPVVLSSWFLIFMSFIVSLRRLAFSYRFHLSLLEANFLLLLFSLFTQQPRPSITSRLVHLFDWPVFIFLFPSLHTLFFIFVTISFFSPPPSHSDPVSFVFIIFLFASPKAAEPTQMTLKKNSYLD